MSTMRWRWDKYTVPQVHRDLSRNYYRCPNIFDDIPPVGILFLPLLMKKKRVRRNVSKRPRFKPNK